MKILVMYSWDDEVSELRWERMQADPELRKFLVEQCFALASDRGTPRADTIFKRLVAAIEKTRPDVLLLHTGAAFHRAPAEFAVCVRRIRAAFPDLRLGYEGRPYGAELLEETGAFEESEAMRELEAAFFG